MIIFKSDRELRIMRRAGLIVSQVLEVLAAAARPGIALKELDQLAEQELAKRGAKASFKGYRGFPRSLCTAVNSEVVHGIPGESRLLDGDILGLDLGAEVECYHGDASLTVAVGNVSEEATRLICVTEEALWKGIEQARPGNRVADISRAIQDHVESAGFGVVRELVGHGVGRTVHEDPQVPNVVGNGSGPVLRKGMTLAIEPMTTAGGFQVATGPDGWAVVTRDGSLSAHFEHTVAITDGEPWVLTALEND